MSKLDALKAAFGDKNQNNNNDNYGENYPFWLMKDGQQAVIRFLPDADEENPLAFLAEKLMHRLTINGQQRSVPCLKMYGEKDCPICALSAEYYKNDDKVNGKKYWRNKQHITRAIIVEDPLLIKDGEESHQGKIRTITLGYQIYEAINQAFQSGDLDDVPYDFSEGCDFIIKKKIVKDGDNEYPSYVYSTFARKSTDVSKYSPEDEIKLIELSSLLPENPGFEKLEEYLQSDLTGSSVESSSTKTSDNSGSTKDKLAELKASTSKAEDSKAEDVDSEADAILAAIMNKNK